MHGEEDGFSLGRPTSNAEARRALGYPDGDEYGRWQQRGTPIRAVLSQPLASPLEDDEAAQAGMSDAPYRKGRGPVPAPTGHSAPITALAWLDLPARLLLTGGKDGVVKVWR
jgi:hypothetical protein